MNCIIRCTGLIGLLAVFWAGAAAADNQILVTDGGYAIDGYDPVAYFVDGAPSRGSTDYPVQWSGATWLFASEQHQKLFEENPERYAPAYGGWCAYGVAEGYAAETDPENAWSIHEGKLYLNWGPEVAADWLSDIPGFLKKSEKNWPAIEDDLVEGDAEIYWHNDHNG